MESKKLSNNVEVFSFSAEETDKVLAKIAAGYGMTLEQYKASTKKEFEDHWCHCKSEGDPIFCDDGVKINAHCCGKHHYHCSNCLKITQVG